MNEKEFEGEMRYRMSLQIAASLLQRGIISEKEYAEIDTKLFEKYRPTLSTLLAGKPLL